MTASAGKSSGIRLGRQISPPYLVAFGIILPLACFVVDFIGPHVVAIAPFGIWILAVLGMTALAFSLRPAGAALHSILIGAIASAGLAASLIGIVLAPFAFVGALMGIYAILGAVIGKVGIPADAARLAITLLGLGLLGLVPLVASFIFLRQAKDLRRHGQPIKVGWVIIGAAIVVLPSAGTQVAEWRWIQHRLDGILQAEPQQIEQSLRELADYRLRFGRGEDWICANISALPLDDQGVRRQLMRIYGPNPVETCRRRESD
jgi:hypothetical protein